MMEMDIKPRFEVEDLRHKIIEREHTVIELIPYEDNGKKRHKIRRETVTVKEPYGFHVYFPNGNSIRVRNEEELIRLNLARPPERVDMNTGEVIPEQGPVSLKKLNEQKSNRRSKTPMRNQLDEAMEDEEAA